MKTISIVPYSESWPGMFSDEALVLEQILLDSEIEHIGSTAVPGLSSKQVIDIIASVNKLDNVDGYIDLLSDQGYKYIPEIELQTPDRKFFQKRTDSIWYHLSLTEKDSFYWTEHMLFRDYLRSHDDAREEYEKLKLVLAKKHLDNFDKYNADKTEFIKSIISKAAAEQRMVQEFE